MAKQVNQKARNASGARSSLVARLNTRLFFRLLGIYLCMDVLLLLLFGAGMFWWADRQCADISALVAERGIPSAEATEWMAAGDYTVAAGEYDGTGWPLPSLPKEYAGGHSGQRYFEPGEMDLFFLVVFRAGNATSYAVECTDGAGEAYTIDLNLSGVTGIFSLATKVLLICQIISLVSNLLKNAGTIKKVLRPIQELTAQAARFNNVSSMSPEELQTLAGRLDAINATHLDDRIPVEGTQRELRDLAQSINAMLERIDRAYRSQARFVSDASHELRTPIAVIQGYANLLDRWGKDDPEAMQESITAIRAEADSMKELVEQLLFLARGDNDSMHIEMEVFDLTAVTGQVLRETQMIDQTHPISAEWGESVYVNADMSLIKQAIRILVDNAGKYTPEGGHITLRVSRQDNTAKISVTDEGQGIDPASLPHIFDRFYRTDESRARQTGGTGLGLAIARWIAEKHEGWFDVVSRKGIGTRMILSLPAIDPPGKTEE